MAKNESALSVDAVESMLRTLERSCATESEKKAFESGKVIDEHQVVDIITFCESPKFLNFLGQDPPIILWPMQRIVLKIFYRGTRGNEHVKLDDNEISLLEKIATDDELDYEEAQGGFLQVLYKYRRLGEFTHLLLIMGRRSSKTTLVSIIAAYEAYKLLETPEGNPQKYYGIAPDKNIHILNVATTKEQALDPLFKEIEARIARSPYFRDKINHEQWNKGEIKLFTAADLRQKEDREKRGTGGSVDGSIILLSGHSNSASLRGHAVICILFDEFAHFKSSTGVSSGDEVYNALTPSMKQFGKDGKVILLSDPKGKEGMFWKIHELSQKRSQNEDGSNKLSEDGSFVWEHDDFLSIQLPTWRVNPNKEFSRDTLEKTERPKDPAAYFTTWGARFMGSGGMKMFDDLKLNDCQNLAYKDHDSGDSRMTYHLHLDPGTTNHNYALALVHVVNKFDGLGGIRRQVVVDKVKYWRPDDKGPVDINKVEREIKDICRRFRVSSVTFDSWQSAQTIQNLQKVGIRAFETPFRDHYITEIYGELRNLVNQNEILLCPDQLLLGEMRCLCYKITGRGITKLLDKKAEYKSDDVVDAVAGASFQALHHIIHKGWPKSRVANTFGR